MSIFIHTSWVNNFSKKLVITALSLTFILFNSEVYSENSPKKLTLENKSFSGSVRAKGIIGLFKVDGRLSFENGFLIWSTGDSKDIGEFEIHEHPKGIKFSATLSIENNEKVEWSGIYDGVSLYDVEAVWTRNEGDFIHDLLLPDVVTLVFTPDKTKHEP